MTRKSFGLMTRKLSVTESQRSAQFRGTVSRRNPSVASANWGARGVAFVVRDVSVHEAPQSLDRIEMRAIGRDEMQLDPAPGLGEPFLYQLGVMIARVVKKDMDQRQQRLERLDRFQQPDRRDGVDKFPPCDCRAISTAFR